MNKNIEVELRALITEQEFIRLNKFLQRNATDLGKDNKGTYFFLFPDKLLKVTNNTTQSTAKITLKMNKIGQGCDFEELEIPIDPQDVDKTITAFKHLGFNNRQYSYQYRHNYEYKGVKVAIKYTQSWGFHVELEILINQKNQKEKAQEKIKTVAKELALQVMTDKQLKGFTDKIDNGWNRGKYTKETFDITTSE